jgi:protein-S-isoprenylcysteine O-methyltransferase Ste14
VSPLLPALLLAVFFGLELAARERGEARSWRWGPDDRLSTAGILAAYVLSVGAVLLVRGGAPPQPLPALGLALMALGLLLRASAMRALGGAYSRTLRADPGHHVVTSGPYRWVRHPGYAASLLVWIGFGLAAGGGLAPLLVTLSVGAAYAWRIRSEERLLRARLGAEYADYARRTSRLLPFLF